MRILAAILLLFWSACAGAQDINLLTLGTSGPIPSSGYTGPLDEVSGATAWYSCTRAAGSAYAASLGNACTVRCGSGSNANNDYTIAVQANGNANVAAAQSYCGTDQTCTSATASASTTLTLTGCSGNITAGDTLTGTGLTLPLYVTSSSCCTSGAGTVIVNTAQTVTAIAVTFQASMYVTESYDQSGSNACSSAPCNISQSTALDQPQLLPSCIGSLPCVGGNSNAILLVAASNYTLNANLRWSVSAVAARLLSSGNDRWISFPNGSSDNGLITRQSAANGIAIKVNGSNTVTGTASDNVFHAENGVAVSGSNATILNVDGTETTATSTPATATGTPTAFNSSGGAPFYETEAGFWDNETFSSANRTALCRNQQAYYGATNFGAQC